MVSTENAPALTLRAIAEDDYDLLYQIYASTRAEEMALTGWGDAHKDAFLQMQFAAQHSHYKANYPGAQLRVVEADGEPAGRLYVIYWPQEIRIMDIALLPDFRRRGIGTRLLRHIMDKGRGLGLPVTIHVERMNPALGLYERLGFRLAEDKGVYLLLRWEPGDAPAER